MSFTSLLQAQNPIDQLLDNLGNLFYLVIFLGAAILPAIKQARDQKKKRERESRTIVMPKVEPSRSPPRSTPQNDLERRVREFFEQQKAERPSGRAGPARPVPPAPKAASSPPSFAPPSRPAPLPPKPADAVVEVKHLHIPIEGLHTDLQHLVSARLPSQQSRQPKPAPRRLVVARSSRGQAGLAAVLRNRRAMKQAILLRELLGPPRGLEDLGR